MQNIIDDKEVPVGGDITSCEGYDCDVRSQCSHFTDPTSGVYFSTKPAHVDGECSELILVLQPKQT